MVMAFVKSTVEVFAFVQCTTSVVVDVAIVVILMPCLLACRLLSVVLSEMVATRA
jgi:hypothetical protein